MSDHFKGIENAEVFEKGVKLAPDHTYLVEMKRTFIKETREHGDAFIAEFTVVESSCPEFPAGCGASWYQSLVKKDQYMSNMAKFAYACLGVDASQDKAKIETEIKPKLNQTLQNACHKNVFEGVKVRIRTEGRTSSKSGEPYVLYNFSRA